MIYGDIDVKIPRYIAYIYNFSMSHIYLFSLIYFISFLLIIPLLFYTDAIDKNELSIIKLNEIDKYKKYIFMLIYFIILIQIILSLYYLHIFLISNNWKFYLDFSLVFISIFEFIIFYLIYRKIKNKRENFTIYFLLILLSSIIIFGEFYFLFQDYYSFFFHTRILISLFMFFSGIHYGLYKKYPDPLKKSLGITIGIIFLIQLVLGELLESAIFGIPPNMDSFIVPLFYIPNISLILSIIHGIVMTVLILIFLYFHSII
ncbi:MAG: hypothetical protein ACP5GJ_00955 [Nanopusillaceae archaeon]